MVKHYLWQTRALVLAIGAGLMSLAGTAAAQEPLPWQQGATQQTNNYRTIPQLPYRQAQATPDPYGPSSGSSTPPTRYPQSGTQPYGAEPPPPPRYVRPYQQQQQPTSQRRYGANQQYPRYDDGPAYREPPRYREPQRYREPRARMPSASNHTYSENEVIDAGHRFFGSLSNGLAKAVQWAFKNSGRPNGYILGEDAGGAFVAGLRYGEGRLYTKHYRPFPVFWQGPSIGYDFGGDGNRTMTLVYNLRSPDDIFRRFGGVQGSAYLVGGVSVQLLKSHDVTLAPIRTGVGLRLGANIGYLKYTPRPTWNPF